MVSGTGQQSWASHRILYGHVLDDSGTHRLDEVLLLLMWAPRSFTGEDVVEIHCHGGGSFRFLDRSPGAWHAR